MKRRVLSAKIWPGNIIVAQSIVILFKNYTNIFTIIVKYSQNKKRKCVLMVICRTQLQMAFRQIKNMKLGFGQGVFFKKYSY